MDSMVMRRLGDILWRGSVLRVCVGNWGFVVLLMLRWRGLW